MSKKPRVSAEQRQFMLQFMMGHEDLAKGRVSGADASRRRGVMLQELASAPDTRWGVEPLSARRSGESVGRTGAVIQRQKRKDTNCTDKAQVEAQALQHCHNWRKLLQFCGIEILVQGLEEVGDPLDLVESVQNTTEEAETQYTVFVELPQEGTPPKEKHKKNKNHNDENLHKILAKAKALKTGLQALASRTPPPK